MTVLTDAALILLFALTGRRSHTEDLTVAGVLDTAWPFLAGAALGHLLLVRRDAAAPGSGAVVWGTALVGGMLLRRATGDGTDPAFVLVATGVLAALLLGWRLVAAAVRRTR